MSRYEEFDAYEKLIKERLSKKRFNHSMNVAEACFDLAERYGADKKRCYLAGLLHDVMKEDSKEKQREMTIASGLAPDPAECETPALWHAVAGAVFVRDELNISDEEIIRAIRFHTIGCAEMSLLEKIVYLGDMISEDRDYKDVDKFRDFCYDDIDKAMSIALIYNVQSVCKKCGLIPRYSFEAYNYYMKFNKEKESL
ncbi:MAG: bis(5'-nucleosyl)-tetraphosphatase (symmetrical) YqeK [Oscillospiraceae bacterium]|nr:bis(5'-nucleosyl)-tetraphosphatase (symmetrical) YqeK [Oscillospiraceae bacterium]